MSRPDSTTTTIWFCCAGKAHIHFQYHSGDLYDFTKDAVCAALDALRGALVFAVRFERITGIVRASALSHHPSLTRLVFTSCRMPPLRDLAGYTELHGLRELVCDMYSHDSPHHLQDAQPLSQLEVLDLPGMETAGADGTLAALPRLRELGLRGLDLLMVPASIASLTRLTRLALSDSLVVADGWQHLPLQLEHLNLRSMLGLSTVPPEVSQLSRLTELDLSHNVELEDGLGALSHLGSLQELNLRSCRLGGLDEALPTALRGLDLSRNRLGAIPAALALLTGLTTLRLNRNRLAGGWQHLAGMQRLATLSLNQCKLAAVPEVLSQLTALTSLDMRYNSIASGWQHLSLLALRELWTDSPEHGVYLA